MEFPGLVGGIVKMNMPMVVAAAGAVGVVVVGLYVWKMGGIANAAKGAAGAAVDVAEGAAVGTVGAIGERFGLPTPDQTTTDPAVARWIIDNYGQMEASKWSSAWAYARSQFMSEGSGVSPPAGSDLARYFAAQPRKTTEYTDESERLLRNHPMPAGTAEQIGQGSWPGYGWGA